MHHNHDHHNPKTQSQERQKYVQDVVCTALYHVSIRQINVRIEIKKRVTPT